MTEIKGLIYGTYPKNDELRIKIGRWERGVLKGPEIEKEISGEKKLKTELFRSTGSDYTDPLFNWYDIFRPFTCATDGIVPGPLTRYKETNTFYRLPEVDHIGRMKVNPSEFNEIEENPPLPVFQKNSDPNYFAFFPSPFSFFKMSKVKEDFTLEKFTSGMISIYSDIMKSYGFKNTLLFESLPYQGEDMSLLLPLVEKFRTILVTEGNLKFADFTPLGKKLHSIAATTEDGNLEIAARHSGIPGIKIIDAHNTKIEDPKAVKQTALEEAKKAGLNSIYVTFNDYLDFLPDSIASKKLEMIREVIN
jgi:5-methyltetrahydropteroyltriglutamate--homocysteine methyltransferase